MAESRDAFDRTLHCVFTGKAQESYSVAESKAYAPVKAAVLCVYGCLSVYPLSFYSKKCISFHSIYSVIEKATALI